MAEFIYDPNSGELYHYGIPGMRWGHRKVLNKLEKQINKNTRKIEKYQKRVARLTKKSDKRLIKSGRYDRLALWTGQSNRFSRRAARRDLRAMKLEAKARTLDPNSEEYFKLKRRAEKNMYKASLAKRKGIIKGKHSIKGVFFERLSARNEMKGKKFAYKSAKLNLKISQLSARNIEAGKLLVEGDNP